MVWSFSNRWSWSNQSNLLFTFFLKICFKNKKSNLCIFLWNILYKHWCAPQFEVSVLSPTCQNCYYRTWDLKSEIPLCVCVMCFFFFPPGSFLVITWEWLNRSLWNSCQCCVISCGGALLLCTRNPPPPNFVVKFYVLFAFLDPRKLLDKIFFH